MLVRGERCLTVMSTFENQILRTLVHVVCNLADPTPKPPGVQSLAGTKGESCCPSTVVVAAGIGSKVQTTALDPIGVDSRFGPSHRQLLNSLNSALPPFRCMNI